MQVPLGHQMQLQSVIVELLLYPKELPMHPLKQIPHQQHSQH